jgi:hypothetical protein
MFIEMQNSNVIVPWWRRQRLMAKFDHIPRNNSSPLIHAQNSID